MDPSQLMRIVPNETKWRDNNVTIKTRKNKKNDNISWRQCGRVRNQKIYTEKIKSNITDSRRANCYQTTGERLTSSLASHGLVRLALAWFDSADFSFLALINWNLNCKILQNLKEKLPDFAVKMFKTMFCLWSYVSPPICKTWKASRATNHR